MEYSIVSNPIHIPAVFAEGGIKNPIEKTLQSGQDHQDATWVNGWGGITMVKIEDGGKAPKGQDFNGVLNALGAHTVFNQNGGRYQWSQDVIDNYSGYAKDFIIQSDDGLREYRSLIDNNTVNPNNGIGSSWLVYAGAGSIPNASSTTAGIMPVLNTLGSNSVNSALSAAMGKKLQDEKAPLSDFRSLRSLNGYQRLAGGIILQWGTVDYSSYPGEIQVDVTYPIVFPFSALNVTTTRKMALHNADGDGGALILGTPARTGFSVSLQAFGTGISQTRGFTWFAIGY